MAPYSIDLRQKILRACKRRFGSQRTIADVFGMSLGFVEKVLRRHRTTGNMAPKPHAGGQKPHLNSATHAIIRHLGAIIPMRRCGSSVQGSLPRQACGSAYPRCVTCYSAWACRATKVPPRQRAGHTAGPAGAHGRLRACHGTRPPAPEVC
jgi:hypothetical protein